MKKLFGVVLLTMSALISKAQAPDVGEQAANFLRESGKLYVVISVLVTIFAGIVIFLIFQERKISKLEKKLKDHEKS